MNTILDLLLLPDLRMIYNGDQVGCLYQDIFEQAKVIYAFINSGIQQGSKIICIIHQETKHRLLNSQSLGNLSIDELCTSGQLVIEDPFPSSEKTIDLVPIQQIIKRELSKGKRQGFPAFRIAIDMSNLVANLSKESDISSVVEDILSLVNKDQDIILFLYPQKTNEANAVFTFLSSHPNIIIHEKLYRNDNQKQNSGRQHLENIIEQRTKELAQTILDLEKEISKRQQMAAFLIESEQRYRALVDGSPAPILVIQEENFVFCNQSAIKMLGISKYDDLVGKSIVSIIDPTGQNIFTKKRPKTRAGYVKSQKIIQLHRPDGETIHFESVSVPITYGGKSAYLMIGYDVTERVNAENALKQSEETSRTLINAVHEAFFLLNPDCTIIAANEEGVLRFNMKSDSIVETSLLSYLPPKAAKEHQKYTEKVIKSGKPAIFESRYKQKYLKNTLYPIFNDQNQVIRLTLYSRDVSHRVLTEKALQHHTQEMEALYRTFLEITTHMDLSTLLPLIVKRAATLLDETSGSLYLVHTENASVELVVSHYQDDDFTGTYLKFGEGLSGKIAQSGEPMFIKNYSTWEEKPNIYRNSTMKRVLGIPLKVAGQVIGVLTISSFQKTDPYTQEEIRLASLFADQAAIAIENTRLLETAQHEIEERKQVTEALKASLAEKEVMLREIHHRVKNNLNVIIALLDLQEDSSKVPEIKPLYNDLKSRVRTMALVHENLYKSADLGRVDFANYIKTLADFLFATYATQIPILIDIDIPSIPMSIDTAIPCGLIVNELVTNAIKYAFPQKQWKLLSNTECWIRIQLKAEDDELVLSVSDNGVGIPSDIDWKNSNTLGLLLVSTLTNQLNGSIEKIPGKGTAFIIRFKQKS